MKSILVIGLGRFGMNLAKEMQKLGNQVMVIDRNASVIDEVSPIFSDAQVADCCSETVLRTLGIETFDICFVTASRSFETSVLCTALLHKLGAKYIVVKASNNLEAEILTTVGANDTIQPEKSIAKSLAVQYNNNNIFDFIELSPEYALYEIAIPSSWIGKSIAQLGVRSQYRVNIVAVKRSDFINPTPDPNEPFMANDHIIIIGLRNDAAKLAQKA